MNNRYRWLAFILLPIAIHAQADEFQIKDSSPDGKFALRAGRAEDDMAIVEKASGKIVQKLEWQGNPWVYDARLYWSADSRRVVHDAPARRGGALNIYLREGNTFTEIKFPENMPHAQVPVRMNRDGATVNITSWGETKVKGWLKSGSLQLESTAEDETQRHDKITITLGFDQPHEARVLKVDATVAHYLTVGDNLELEGTHDLAMKAYNQALAINPKNAGAWQKRGAAKEAGGDLDGALADYEHALKIDPKDSAALSSRAHVRITKGDLQGALADETTILKFHPDIAYWTSLERGSIFYAQQEWAKALRDFRRPIDLKPGDSGHAYILVWLTRVKLGEKEAADQELAAALTAKHLESWDLETDLARYALGQATEEELLKSAESSSAKTYPDCEAWFLIGFKQALAGDKTRAAESFNKCLAAAKQKLPPQYWLPPESHLAGGELKALDGKR